MSAEEVLQILSQESPLTSTQLAQRLDCDHQKIVGSIKSLECLGDVISSKLETIKKWQLTQEGEMVAKDGSHEAIVFHLVPTAGIPQAELMKAAGSVGKVGFSKAMSAGWITLDKTAVPPLVRRKVESVQDTTQVNLAAICSQGGDVVAEKEKVELKKRKLVQEITEKIYILEKGSNFTTSITKAETDLTPEMISSGDWKNISFKPYNFDALGVSPDGGTLHPLLKVRSEYRQIFLEMGFTGNIF